MAFDLTSTLSRVLELAKGQQMTLVLPLLLVAAVFVQMQVRRRRSLPPGPTPVPIIGNVLQMPKSHEWFQYAKWGEEYGPIVHAKIFGQSLIILNSHSVALDLLDNQQNSDRPRNLVMALELIGWNRGVALKPYGEAHRRYRKLLARSILSPAAVRDRVAPYLQDGAEDLIHRLRETPEDFLSHIRESVGDAVVRITYGRNVTINGLDYIPFAEKVNEIFTLVANPYSYAVDIVPFLRYIPEWLPGAGFKKQARDWSRELETMVEAPFESVKDDMAQGVAAPSYVSELLNDVKGDVETEKSIAWTASSLYAGGSDTTITALMSFFLAMALHPEVQLKAQKEIDEVMGRDRLPTLQDRDDLPYVAACAKEVLRWRPVAPLGIPHRCAEGQYFQGFYIPKGTTILANIWAMCRDPKVYHSPDSFLPERFLEDREPEIDTLAFGFGRRVCPGLHMASATMFVYVACTLAAFSIRPKDKEGVEALRDVKYRTGLISVPEPFECTVVPR